MSTRVAAAQRAYARAHWLAVDLRGIAFAKKAAERPRRTYDGPCTGIYPGA